MAVVARAFDSDVLIDRSGNVIQNALGTLYTDQAASVLVTDAYNAASAGALITTVTTDSSGRWSVWFATPKSYWVKWTDNSDTAYPAGSPSTPVSFTTFVSSEHQAFEKASDESATNASTLTETGTGTTPTTTIQAGLNRFRDRYYLAADYGGDIQAAITAAIAAGVKHVVTGKGTFAPTSTITAANVRGLRLTGEGIESTIIAPTSGIGANPTLRVTDHRDVLIEGMTIRGYDSTTTACVNSHRAAASPTYNSRGMTLRDVRLGADSGSNMQVGFLTTAAGGADSNNDYHNLDRVEIANATVAACSFEHYNSLHHDISSLHVTTCPIGLRNTTAGGGTWTLRGGEFEAVTDVIFDLNGTGDTTHPFVMQGFTTEACNALLRSDAGGAHVLMVAFGMYGATTNTDIVSWAPGATGTFVMDDAWILTGQTGTRLRFSDVAGSARVTNCILGLTDIIYNGDLVWKGNRPRSVQTFTAGASATLHAGGDYSGPYKQGTFTRHAASTDSALAAAVTNDSVDRFTVDATGKQSWGSGAAAADTTLLRSAAGELSMKATGSNIGYFEIDNSSASAETALLIRQNGVNKWRMKVAAGATNLSFADDSNVTRVTLTNQGNMGIGSTSFGNGQGVISLADRAAAPNVNPSGGGRLYSESGALKWQGSSGTVTTVAPA